MKTLHARKRKGRGVFVIDMSKVLPRHAIAKNASMLMATLL